MRRTRAFAIPLGKLPMMASSFPFSFHFTHICTAILYEFFLLLLPFCCCIVGFICCRLLCGNESENSRLVHSKLEAKMR